MPDSNAEMAPLGRIAVVDVGSNSLRLVVFEPVGWGLLPLLNEKVMCGLGRGITTSGRLNREGIELAFANLRRFVALARALSADHLAIIATAAVRDAADGEDFAAEAARRCGVPVRIVDGGEEARLSAAGVLAGIPDADGVVGDLGGGSVELVRVRGGGGAPAIGHGITLPIGPLQLADIADNRRDVTDAIDEAIGSAAVLRAAAGRALYLVGGAWRAIARLHMEQTRYPLHIIHDYTIQRRPAEAFLDIVGGQSRRSLERVRSINRKRLETVPLAALILRRLIAAGRPELIVFSAFGLREGYAYGLLPRPQHEDPLIASAIALAASQGRSRSDRDRLAAWTAPLFPDLGARERRLHRAASWLSDLAWAEHPDYRAEHAFTRSLRMPVPAIGHAERVFIASVLHARYGGQPDDPVTLATRPLLDDPAAAEARSLGLALRLAYTLCGGALELLDEVALARDGDSLMLEASPRGALFEGEAVQRRLDALGRSLGLATKSRRLALA